MRSFWWPCVLIKGGTLDTDMRTGPGPWGGEGRDPRVMRLQTKQHQRLLVDHLPRGRGLDRSIPTPAPQSGGPAWLSLDLSLPVSRIPRRDVCGTVTAAWLMTEAPSHPSRSLGPGGSHHISLLGVGGRPQESMTRSLTSTPQAPHLLVSLVGV